MTKSKKKMNAYVKILLMLALGGVIGGMFGLLTGFNQGRINTVVADSYEWICLNVSVIIAVLLVLALIVLPICYRKGEKIMRQIEQTVDEEQQDKLDSQYDFWNTVGIGVSNVIVITEMVIFAFKIPRGEEAISAQMRSGMTTAVVLFLVVAIICTFYQVAAIKQARRKDPSKKGEASDLYFHKEWLQSCDEAEKRVIYQASYKALCLMQTFMMFALAFAMLGQACWGTGMMAIVLLGICYLVMMTAYCIYSLRLQKTRLDG